MKYLATIVTISLLLVTGVQRPAAAVSDDWLIDGLDTVIEEATLLGEAGAFTSHTLVDLLVDYNGWGFAPEERADLLVEIDWADDYGVDSLFGAPAELSSVGVTVFGAISATDRAALQAGQTGFMDPQPYLHTIGDLLRRRGQAPVGIRDPLEELILDGFIREWSWSYDVDLADYAESPPVTTTTTIATTTTTATTVAPTTAPAATAAPTTVSKTTRTTAAPITAAPTTLVPPSGVPAADAGSLGADGGSSTSTSSGTGSTTAGSGGTPGNLGFDDPTGAGSDDPADLLAFNAPTEDVPTVPAETGQGLGGGSWLPLALLALLILAAGGVGWLLLSRRPGKGQDFRLIAETSRKLAACDNQPAVVHTAVVDTVLFTGADAGAYLRVASAGLTLAEASDESLFATPVIERGTLFDVAQVGQSIRTVAERDPAFGGRSVALAAAPVLDNGQVIGVLVVTRDPSAPFGTDVLEALGALASMLASALQSTLELEAAVQGSEVDWLTSLSNRRRFDTDLSNLTATSQRMGVAMVDIDHFKSINDTYGHETGDLVIKSVAQTIASVLRSSDRAYRYGGEEFSVLLPGCTNAEAAEVMEKVRLAVQHMVLPDTPATRRAGGSSVTVSVGLTLGPARYAVELLAAADEALYMAKRDGRNRVIARAAAAGVEVD